MTLLDKFKKAIMPDGIYNGRRWKSHYDLRAEIDAYDMGEFKSLEEKIMALRFNLTSRPLCVVCGNNFTKIISPSEKYPTGFRRTCSLKCAANDESTKSKTKKTLEVRYGGHHMRNEKMVANYVENNHKNGAYHKGKETLKRNHGIKSVFSKEDVKNKIRRTNRDRYGCNNPMQNAEVKKRSKATTLNRHGAFFNPHKTKQTLLNKYGTSNFAATDEVKKKRADTILHRYGVAHAMHLDSTKSKIIQTNRIRYGADNPMQNVEVKTNSRKKIRETMYDKLTQKLSDVVVPLFTKAEYVDTTKLYDWRCVSCRNEFKDHLTHGRIPRCVVCRPFKFGALENDIADYIRAEFKLPAEKLTNAFSDNRQEIDIFVEQKNIGIEINGVYWHSEKFKDRFYHQNKTLLAKKHGIKLIHIFEDEWENKRDKVISILRSKFGLNNTVFARNCELKQINSKICNEFLDIHHLDSSVKGAKINLGLYLHDELVMVAAFGASRYHKKYKWELYRLASMSGLTIIGGVSKLVKHFRKIYTGSLMSYADLSHSTGEGYLKAGFRFEKYTQPGYFYVDSKMNRISRYAAQPKRLNKLLDTVGLSEAEAVASLKYNKVWNCGHAIYVMD